MTLIVFLFNSGMAQTKKDKGGGSNNATALSAEAQSAKALLEDLISRRYSQDLSTLVDRQAFSIGTNLDLIYTAPKDTPTDKPKEEEPMHDLMLGVLDPEELLKKFTPPDQKQNSHGFLNSYQIKTVNMSVGLRDGLGDSTKGEIEKWLKDRLNKEFGKVGQGTVALIKLPEIKELPSKPKAKPKDLLEFLDQFQALSGQIVLGLAILLATLLWKILGASKSTANVNMNGTSQVSGQLQGGGGGGPSEIKNSIPEGESEVQKHQRQVLLEQEVESISNRIAALLPRVSQDLENIIRSWCQMGEEGKFRLACFAEVVGKDIGKLPIPIDALSDITKVFARMSQIDTNEKKLALQKAYWDFLAVVNLGTESLNQPFAYLGNMNLGLVNQVLMEENPKMQTLVSLFMPENLRIKYIRNLTKDVKVNLLREAVQLNEIAATELKSLDGSLAGRLKPSNTKDVVSLEKTFNRIASALSPSEEVTILHELSSSIPLEYKKSNPSLAFLGEWPEDKLGLFLSSVMANELTAFLRLRGDLQDKLIRLAPPMTAEMVSDELSRPSNESEKDRDHWIHELHERLKNWIDGGTLSLEEIFKESPPNENLTGPGGTDEFKKAS